MSLMANLRCNVTMAVKRLKSEPNTEVRSLQTGCWGFHNRSRNHLVRYNSDSLQVREPERASLRGKVSWDDDNTDLWSQAINLDTVKGPPWQTSPNCSHPPFVLPNDFTSAFQYCCSLQIQIHLFPWENKTKNMLEVDHFWILFVVVE